MDDDEQYTPTDDQVKCAFVEFNYLPTTSLSDEGLLSLQEATGRWERWIAEHDARVKAEALREAAQLRHGTDLIPTTDGNRDVMWWYDYLQSLDRTWRDRLNRLADEAENE